MGLKAGKTGHVQRCRRCGRRSYHVRHSACSSCGYGKSAKLRKYNWNKKVEFPTVIPKKKLVKPVKVKKVAAPKAESKK